MLLYALVASDCSFAVDVFLSRELAEQALADVLNDEPAFVDILSIAPVADESEVASHN